MARVRDDNSDLAATLPPIRTSRHALPPWLMDVVLGLAVALVVSVTIAADVEGTGPDAWAYLWAIGLGALMLARRRYPVVVLALSVAAVLSYYAAGYPSIGVAVPLAAAVFSAAERGRTRAAVLAALSVLAVSVGYRLIAGQDPRMVLGYDLPSHALLLGASIALGDSLRARRQLRRRQGEVAALTAERLTQTAQQRATEERLVIARDLHDSVGHALTVVALHAQIAEEALAEEPDAPQAATARDAVRVIATTTAATFVDVRGAVKGLRDGDPGRASLGLADLDIALAPARTAGLDVRCRVAVASPLSAAHQATIYRIVQESITNILRHSPAMRVDIDVRERDGQVQVAIVDDGAIDEGPRPPSPGGGLLGMQERVSQLGGAVSAGPVATGFAVQATFPVKET